jgi:hypothetical protein
MRVLHLVATSRSGGRGAVEAAEALVAAMASQSRHVVVDELDLVAAHHPMAQGRPVHVDPHGGGAMSRRRRGADQAPASAVARIRRADLLVLTVACAEGAGALGDLVTEVRSGPARPTLGVRRGLQRRPSRMVVVAAHPDDEGCDALAGLMAEVREAFACHGVSDIGLISGAPADAPNGGPVLRARSSARRWTGAEPPQRTAAAS